MDSNKNIEIVFTKFFSIRKKNTYIKTLKVSEKAASSEQSPPSFFFFLGGGGGGGLLFLLFFPPDNLLLFLNLQFSDIFQHFEISMTLIAQFPPWCFPELFQPCIGQICGGLLFHDLKCRSFTWCEICIYITHTLYYVHII